MPEIIGNEKDVEWVRPAVMPGMAIKVLGPYKETESWWLLVECDAGMELPAETHPCAQYCYTLEGQIECKGKVYGPGTYMLWSEGVEHGPFSVVGDKPWVSINVFTGSAGLEEMIPELKPFME